MGLKDIVIKNSYDSNIDDVINDFYIPALSQAIRYDRIAGFFTSSSLAISARGILNMLENNKTPKGCKIRILASPRLSQSDVELINSASSSPERHINEILYQELVSEQVDIVSNYRALLAHLIAKDIVEIRLVYIIKDGCYQSYDEIEKSSMFHQKVGILYDNQDNAISFSGSINESFTAWNDNIEEFKTFQSWIPGVSDYCRSDIDKFNAYWNRERPNTYITDLPDAIRNQFIEIANTSDFKDLKAKILKRKAKHLFKEIQQTLFPFQKDALQQWLENNRRMLFAMATGTGKTRTAIACMTSVMEQQDSLVIIATPQTSLNKQWETEIEKLDIEFERKITCDSTNPKYKQELAKYISWLKSGALHNLGLFVTHATASSSYFINTVSSLQSSNCKILFIGDEVHGMGSIEHKKALLECYDYRIGLSATPERWFDDEGSDILKEYFGNRTFEFGIEEALTTFNPLTNRPFLSKYRYFIRSAYLTAEEDERYNYYTQKYLQVNGKDKEAEERRQRLLIQRSAILKKAENKLDTFASIIDEIRKKQNIRNTIVFCADGEQVSEVLNILKQRGIFASSLTEKQGSAESPQFNGMSERNFIIQQFKDELIEVLVAIKCMDEGIDIPSADTAIIISSTTNPREYIQRIGRVIRNHPGKQYANIYDIAVKSTDENINASIRKNEDRRLTYIVSLASNGSETIKEIYR